MTTTKKSETTFRIISVIALVWNIIGVLAYLKQAFMTDDMIAILPEAEKEMYESKPAWATAAFAIAVFAGFLGSLGLLMRKKWATPLFIISLIGILLHQVYLFVISGVMADASPSVLVMPALVTIIGIYLVWYSSKSTTVGILR